MLRMTIKPEKIKVFEASPSASQVRSLELRLVSVVAVCRPERAALPPSLLPHSPPSLWSQGTAAMTTSSSMHTAQVLSQPVLSGRWEGRRGGELKDKIRMMILHMQHRDLNSRNSR